MYERMYGILFTAITDSLEQIEACNYGIAAQILKKAQRETEEVYIGRGGPDPSDLDHSLTSLPMTDLPSSAPFSPPLDNFAVR